MPMAIVYVTLRVWSIWRSSAVLGLVRGVRDGFRGPLRIAVARSSGKQSGPCVTCGVSVLASGA